jgi:hypothetical protein
MSIEKAQVKVGTAHEIGCRLDDALEAATKDLYRLEGAAQAFRQAAQSVEGLAKHVDREMDEGKFDLETAKLIKKYVERAHQMMTNLTMQADNNRMAQTGKVSGAEAAVQLVKKFRDDEERKAEALRVALAARAAEAEAPVADEGPRPVGLRPGASIKERRLAEELAAQAPPEPLPEEPRKKKSKRA